MKEKVIIIVRNKRELGRRLGLFVNLLGDKIIKSAFIGDSGHVLHTNDYVIKLVVNGTNLRGHRASHVINGSLDADGHAEMYSLVEVPAPNYIGDKGE